MREHWMSKKLNFFLIFSIVGLMFFSCRDQLIIQDVTVKVDHLENIDVPTSYEIDSQIPTPVGVTVSQGSYSDRIRIQWEPVYYSKSTIKYHIYRYEADESDPDNPVKASSSPVLLTGVIPKADLIYEDLVSNGIKYGKTYFYQVFAVSQANKTVSEPSVLTAGYTLASPSVFRASYKTQTDRITLNWSAAKGAFFYMIERAEEPASGVKPSDEQYQPLINQFITDTTYEDFGTTLNGTVVSGKVYYYRLSAYYSLGVKSDNQSIAIGAVRVTGTPDGATLKTVSKGSLRNAIRIEWEPISGVSDYEIYRITQDEFNSGNAIGSKIDKNENSFKIGTTSCYYYDLSKEAGNGSKFYYRVSGINEFGEGQLSDLEDFSAQFASTGYAIASYTGGVNVVVTMTDDGKKANQIYIDECKGADSYYVFRIYSKDNNKNPLEESVSDVEWGLPIGKVEKESGKELIYTDLFSVISATHNPLVDVAYYRVLPFSSSAVSDYTIDGSDVKIGISPNVAKWSSEIDEIKSKIPSWDGICGYSNFSAPKDSKIEPPKITSFNATQGSVVSGVKVNAQLSSMNGVGIAYGVRLVRSCEYGEEEGVYCFSLPPEGHTNFSAGDYTAPIDYFKEGVAPIKNTINYNYDSLKSSFNTTGTLNWDDPMPDFDRSGKVIPGKKLVWNYKNWDREAWKHILRGKEVDMDRYFPIDYKLEVYDLTSGDAVVSSTVKKGWPLLSDFEAGSLCRWVFDIFLNRAWIISIPRYNSDTTRNTLLKGAMSGMSAYVNGQGAGQIMFSFSISGGSGGTQGDWFYDWEDFKIKVAVSLGGLKTDDGPYDLEVKNIEVDTPYFKGIYAFKFKLRSNGLFWGLANYSLDSADYKGGGYISVKMNYPVNRALKSFAPTELYPIGHNCTDAHGAWYFDVTGYDPDVDVDPIDLTDASPLHNPDTCIKNNHHAQYNFNDCYHSSVFTRIGCPARPVPCGSANDAYEPMTWKNEITRIIYRSNPW